MNINDIDLLDADRFVRMEHHDMFTTLREMKLHSFGTTIPMEGVSGMLFDMKMLELSTEIMNCIQVK